jgi:hypothetical protein
LVRLLFLVLLLSGCNAYIGIPNESSEQPWRSFYIFSFISLFILPFVSTFFALKAAKKDITYKVKVQKYLNYSLVLLIGLYLLMEMSLTPNTNIRFDLFIVLVAVISQILAVFSGWYNLRKARNF